MSRRCIKLIHYVLHIVESNKKPSLQKSRNTFFRKMEKALNLFHCHIFSENKYFVECTSIPEFHSNNQI